MFERRTRKGLRISRPITTTILNPADFRRGFFVLDPHDWVFIHALGLVLRRLSSMLLCSMNRSVLRSTIASLAFILIAAMPLFAQVEEAPLFKTTPLPEVTEELSPSFFAENRERLRDTLRDSGMAVIFSAPVRYRTNDIEYRYQQDPDFFYFTGVRAENAALIVFRSPVQIEGKWYREILFIEEQEDKKEMWSGEMLTPEEAMDISGIGAVMFNTKLKTLPIDWKGVKRVYTNRTLRVERDDKMHPGDLASMVKHVYNKAGRSDTPVLIDEGEDLFAYLRQSKSSEELRMIQTAIDITCQAHNNVMRMIEPGMTEYQLEAIIEYTFRYAGADGPAFPSIVASGDNGAIMHYTENEDLLIPGDLVIMDIGAQYQGYAADITRTIPISGKFSEEQAQVYQLVLDAQTVAIRYATKGYKFWTPHEEAYRTIGKGLIKLGIIKEWSEISDYFVHGTSHYLGLDVHDPGIYSALKPGEVITVEPGIYIPEGSKCDPKWWGIHVRIEDDILITHGAAKVLSEATPRKISEIEDWMSGESALND